MKLTPLMKLCLCLVLLLAAFTLRPLPAFATCSACLGSHSITCSSFGSTCALAQDHMLGYCQDGATNAGVCGIFGYACNFSATSQSSCYWNGSQYEIDASGTVGCQYCGQNP